MSIAVTTPPRRAHSTAKYPDAVPTSSTVCPARSAGRPYASRYGFRSYSPSTTRPPASSMRWYVPPLALTWPTKSRTSWSIISEKRTDGVDHRLDVRVGHLEEERERQHFFVCSLRRR